MGASWGSGAQGNVAVRQAWPRITNPPRRPHRVPVPGCWKTAVMHRGAEGDEKKDGGIRSSTRMPVAASSANTPAARRGQSAEQRQSSIEAISHGAPCARLWLAACPDADGLPRRPATTYPSTWPPCCRTLPPRLDCSAARGGHRDIGAAVGLFCQMGVAGMTWPRAGRVATRGQLAEQNQLASSPSRWCFPLSAGLDEKEQLPSRCDR